MTVLVDFSVIAVLILGIRQFRQPAGARLGNWLAALALGCAFVLVLFRHGVDDVFTVLVALAAGAAAGYLLARLVDMIHMPAMVAFQHGAGGVAAFLVSLVELSRLGHGLGLIGEISGLLGLAIGALTFSGSMIASAKLAGRMRQAPQALPGHDGWVLLVLLALIAAGVASCFAPAALALALYVAVIALGAVLGVLVAMRIGGADMPVLISALNATAGVAASLCGMLIASQLLIAFGATVAASGSILTLVMCRAMNRKFRGVIMPRYTAASRPASPAVVTPDPASPAAAEPVPSSSPGGRSPATGEEVELGLAAEALAEAGTVILIPGYGMALAKAQQEVANLAATLVARGKTVRYAIHPVAGRMPGHMNVLLAEVGVDYEMLVEMETINEQFPVTDCAVVVGACDVVNPAAVEVEGTPISGMPILMAHLARRVVCCNFDRRPGYSGVANSLYLRDNVTVLEGDARHTVASLHERLLAGGGKSAPPSAPPAAEDPRRQAALALAGAKRVVIIPGYGMALAKAQFTLVKLASRLRQGGATVNYAIHPVAGRMPGHMNVLLAEAEVEYEDLLEMEEANPIFAETDVALVVGACDVVNPAAVEVEGTPISGMPILHADRARRVIVCNFDTRPGYSGVANPLYGYEKTIVLTGDARQTAGDLLAALDEV